MMDSLNDSILPVPLDAIDTDDALTDFSLSPVPSDLTESIRETGVVHPVLLAENGGVHRIVCGHRRVRAARHLGLSHIPARMSPAGIGDAERLSLNLSENRAHRSYSDVEKGFLLGKLTAAGISEECILEKYMPWIGLARSKKWFDDLVRVRELGGELARLLHTLNVPARVFAGLYRWSAADRQSIRKVLAALTPGSNKCRDLIELVEETAAIAGQTPEQVLEGEALRDIVSGSERQPHEQYDALVQQLSARRYPHWSELRKQAARALDRLKLESGTRLRFQETFESDALHIEIKFCDQASLIRQADALQRAAQSQPMRELLGVFKDLEG